MLLVCALVCALLPAPAQAEGVATWQGHSFALGMTQETFLEQAKAGGWASTSFDGGILLRDAMGEQGLFYFDAHGRLEQIIGCQTALGLAPGDPWDKAFTLYGDHRTRWDAYSNNGRFDVLTIFCDGFEVRALTYGLREGATGSAQIDALAICQPGAPTNYPVDNIIDDGMSIYAADSETLLAAMEFPKTSESIEWTIYLPSGRLLRDGDRLVALSAEGEVYFTMILDAQGDLQSLQSANAGLCTARGLRLGDTPETIRALYGADYRQTETGEIVIDYEAFSLFAQMEEGRVTGVRVEKR